MKTHKYKCGLTLVEMLTVVAIIALLATMVIRIAARIDTQSKERSLEGIFALLESALQEYHEYTGSFPEQLEKNFTMAVVHSEYLCEQLHRIPNSRKVLGKISDSLIENKYGVAGTPPEIYDPWGTALDYRYIPGDNFPELISAGPDRIFGNADDISNK